MKYVNKLDKMPDRFELYRVSLGQSLVAQLST
jgi:hypothetical protein